MTRILLVSGCGGVGKTTVAAATGLAAARRGLRTLVFSFDTSRDLSGAFGLDVRVRPESQGLPVRVEESLHLQELDVPAELQRRWSAGRGEVAALLGGGLEEVTAEEVALTPGLDALLALLLLDEHTRARTYELIVIDGPSLGDLLRFVGGADAVSWFARRSRPPEQSARRVRAARGDPDVLHAVSDRLMDVGALLRDPSVTTVRWVTTLDTRARQATRRACTALGLQGVALDGMVFNRLVPGTSPVEGLQDLAGAVPATEMERQGDDEVSGIAALESFASRLYRGEDPVRPVGSHPVLGVRKDAVDEYRLEVQLPFVRKEEVALSRREAELVIQVGALRRNVLLPRMVARLATSAARMDDGKLVVEFKKERVQT
ncbi:ArsA family ATPase [Myxococcus landrumensis]|uniref:arsenite-transporting ATPase n=2 Tax=Myxococcus landrumensis TaxID=2813577 RepID=A0ABX7NM31_9BACT|nr:ArsA family ATPase [Myxococcus landrumus]